VTLDEVLVSLFPLGHDVRNDGGVLMGTGTLPGEGRAIVIGVADGITLGVDEAIRLSNHLLMSSSLDGDGGPVDPIIVLVDSGSQRMSKRDELLGLNEFLAHLAKTLVYADLRGRPAIGVLYGHAAAGAFLATALATRVLVALPGAAPAVMDLPSMARVTKLPLDVLEEKARTTPVFAPGVSNLASTGAVHMTWDEARPLADQLNELLENLPDVRDRRDELGQQRHGRMKAFEIAERVRALAVQSR
jgi:malonate decarboxylase gamma subunit